MRNRSKAVLTGALLAAAYIVAPGPQTVEAQQNALLSSCTYAEYINWHGACRGATVRLCKGDANCPTPIAPDVPG
jgi:hypothetical protein